MSILCSFVWHEGVGSSRLTKKIKGKKKRGLWLEATDFWCWLWIFLADSNLCNHRVCVCVLVLHDMWWEAMPRTHNVYCGHDDTLRSIWISIVCSLQLHECVSSSCLSKIYIRKKQWGKKKVSQGYQSNVPFWLTPPPIAKTLTGSKREKWIQHQTVPGWSPTPVLSRLNAA